MEKKLFTPITIGNVTLKNRVVFPSVCSCLAEEDGTVGNEFRAYVREHAKGGCGLVLIPGSPHGEPTIERPFMRNDAHMQGWKQMADICHEYGAKLFCALHPVQLENYKDNGNVQHAPTEPEDYSEAFIMQLCESYTQGAVKCKEAGVDGVEILGAHSQEFAKFLSAKYNRRTDEYGGSAENRARFPMQLIRMIKEAAGADFPVLFRMSGFELTDGEEEIAEVLKIAKYLEDAGADALDVSCGMENCARYVCAPMDVDQMFNLKNIARIKQAVSIPVIGVGRITDMEQAVQIVENGDVDMVGMGRAQLADPELVNKYLGKNAEPPRRCLGCNQGCFRAMLHQPMRCMQNPRVGRENVLEFNPVSEERAKAKIMIVGAGPAGLEMACDLYRRGYQPVVWEKDGRPGGLVNLASMPPRKDSLMNLIDYRVKLLEQYHGVIRYNQTVDTDLIRAEKPDILILATGSQAVVPPIPGIDGANVYTGDEALRKGTIDGERIAVLGAGLVGCETAEYLAAQGKQVTIFEMKNDIAKELSTNRRGFMLERMSKLGIEAHLLSCVKNIRLPFIDVALNTEEAIMGESYCQSLGSFDAVVVALGRRSVNTLEASVRKELPDIHVITIGDCRKPGFAIDAVTDAAVTAATV